MNVNRRTALHILGSIGAGATLYGCGPESTARRPNILFVMTDDQAYNQMSCYGHPYLQTPNMDRLATEGARFDNCFCTNSLCAPSRASVLTGCYSNINGIQGNSEKKGGEERLNPDLPTFPEMLQQAGYYTALVGKYHIRQDPKGFDEWQILPGQGSYFDPEFIENGVTKQYNGYVSDIITDKALDVLKQREDGKPFCMVYQHKGPHRPFTPAPRHADLWDDIEFPYPATFNDDYATRKIAKLAEDMRIEVSLESDYPDMPNNLTVDEKKQWIYQRFVKDSCRAVTSIDENLGRVLDYLDENGMADDTMIIYTSDNGFFYGEHGWYDKRFMYEPSLRLPLVVRYPRLGFSGKVVGDMVLNVDFAPTILDCAGVDIPEVMHGRSMLPLLTGSAPADWRQSVYYEYYEDSWRMYQNLDPEDLNDQTYTNYFTAHRVGPHRGVRTDRYKLIEYYTEDDYWELFDLENDPYEVRNIHGEPGYAGITEKLTTELRRLQSVYGSSGNL